jgi:hypothetical protein
MTRTISFEVEMNVFNIIEELAKRNGWSPKQYATMAVIEKVLQEEICSQCKDRCRCFDPES